MISNSDIFFSIIIPTHNRAKMISIAVESVLSQTFNNWELIIIDDGSSDYTEKLILSYVNNDSRIKYFYQEKKGRSSARNLGIEKSIGHFICFLDDDDYYLVNFLEEFYNEIKLQNFDTAVYFCRQYEKIDNKLIIYDNERMKYIYNLTKMYFNYSNVQSLCTSSIIFKNLKFDERFDLGEDFHFFVKVFLNSNAYFIDEYLCVAVTHNEGTMKNELSKGYFHKFRYNRLDVFDDLIKKYSPILIKKKVFSDLINMNNRVAYFYESSRMKSCEYQKSSFNRFIYKFQYTDPIYFYYIISLLFRYPYYYLKCYLKNGK